MNKEELIKIVGDYTGANFNNYILGDLLEPTEQDINEVRSEYPKSFEDHLKVLNNDDIFDSINVNVSNGVYNQGSLPVRESIMDQDFFIDLLDDLLRELSPEFLYANYFIIEEVLTQIFLDILEDSC